MTGRHEAGEGCYLWLLAVAGGLGIVVAFFVGLGAVAGLAYWLLTP